MDDTAVTNYVNRLWDDSIVAELTEYIRIPNKSVAFDPEWIAHGYMERVVERFTAWARRQPIEGLTLEVIRLAQRTPLIFIEIPGDPRETILLYGHLDKQPEMAGWRSGLDPWKPVLEGDRLYGRGAADDGYALFACLAAIGALQAQGIPHARCVIVIEACEESGSFDLPPYIDHLAARIGTPSLVIALDSGCATYDQLWCTTSLRGPRGRYAHRRYFERGRAFGRRRGHRAVNLSHRAAASEPYRRRGFRPHHPARVLYAYPG